MIRFSLSRLVLGSVSGFVATIPQTLAMEVIRLLLPTWPGRFPPRQVAEGFIALATPSRTPPKLSEPAWHAITAVSHFGYGTAVGSLYSIMPNVPRSTVGRGAAFGLLVWAGSYGGLLPALGIVKPQADLPVRKNAQLIAAHVAWGITNALLFEKLTATRRR